MRCGIIVQARMNSSRLQGKMLMDVGGMPLVLWVLKRCALSERADVVILASSTEASDDPLVLLAQEHSFEVFRGSLRDVRGRFIQAAERFSLDYICRVCGDSPFVDVRLIDAMFEKIMQGSVEYLYPQTPVAGFLSEVFTADALRKSALLDDSEGAKEHVTPVLRKNFAMFCQKSIEIKTCHSQKLTVDTLEDVLFVRRLVESGVAWDSSTSTILRLLANVEKRESHKTGGSA